MPSDLPDIRPKLKNLQNYIKSYELSPSGKKVLFEARGEIFLLGSKNEIIKMIKKDEKELKASVARWAEFNKRFPNE